MKTVIIFEGHDTAGKSSIAAALSEKLNIPVFKAKRDKRWWDPSVNLHYYTEGITQFIEQTECSVILDRWHPSDYMYSALFGRDISHRKIEEIDVRMSNLNTLIVYCYKDQEKYIDDVEDKEFVNKEMYAKMTKHYEDFDNKYSSCRSLWLNTSNQKLDRQLAAIIKAICQK